MLCGNISRIDEKEAFTRHFPTRAVRLRNGKTLISDQFNNQVIEIDRDKEIIFVQGKIAVTGHGFGLLNGPYDAKVVGDYTGLTRPPRREDESDQDQ
jgi:hypothetical protein